MAKGSTRHGGECKAGDVPPEPAADSPVIFPGASFSLAPWSEIAVRTEAEIGRDAARTGSVAPPPQLRPPPPAKLEEDEFTFFSPPLASNGQRGALHAEEEEATVSGETPAFSFAPAGKVAATAPDIPPGTKAELRSFSFTPTPAPVVQEELELSARSSPSTFAPASQEDFTAPTAAQGELPCFSFTPTAEADEQERDLSDFSASLKSPLAPPPGAKRVRIAPKSAALQLAYARQQGLKWEPNVLSNTEKLTAALAANDVATVRELAKGMSCEELEETSPWNRETVITTAAKKEQWEIVDVLREAVSAPGLLLLCVEGRSALSWAAKHGNVEVLRRLLDKVSGEKGVLEDNWRWKKGTESPVHAAIIGGHQDCLEALVERSNIHQLTSCDLRGRTPLMLCAELDNDDCTLASVLIAALPSDRLLDKTLHSIPTLAQRKASFESSLGMKHLGSALDDAIKLDNKLLMELLIQAAPIQQLVHVTAEGASCLMTATKADNAAAAGFIAFCVPGSVEAAHRHPPTPLAVAAANGSVKICELFVTFMVELVKLPSFAKTIRQECPALLAAKNKHDELAIWLLSKLPFRLREEGYLLTEAFNRTDSALLTALLSEMTELRDLEVSSETVLAVRHDSWMHDHDLNFQNFLASAPLRNYELLIRAFPRSVTAWLSFSHVIDPIELTKLTAILELVLDQSPAQSFEVVLKDILLYAMTTKQKEHFVVGLHYCFDKETNVSRLKRHNTVTACISKGQTEYLLLCLEHLPQCAWYAANSHPCRAVLEAVAADQAACLRALLDTLPRHMWLDHFPEQASSPLIQCFMGPTLHMEVLEVLLEYLSEEELMLSNVKDGWAAIHFAARRHPCVFVPLAEKLSQESLMSQTVGGLSPLHIAAKGNYAVNVEWLVQHLPYHAKSLRDNQGRTPADIAGNEVIGAMLLAQPKAALTKR